MKVGDSLQFEIATRGDPQMAVAEAVFERVGRDDVGQRVHLATGHDDTCPCLDQAENAPVGELDKCTCEILVVRIDRVK